MNSVIITGAWVYDNQDDMLFMMEFGSAGEPLQREDVEYVLYCTEPDGTFHYRSAALGDSNGDALDTCGVVVERLRNELLHLLLNVEGRL